MIIDPGDANPAADSVNGVYLKRRALRSGDKVLDLGAHRGYFSRIVLDTIGSSGAVVAFEPHPGNFARLTERCPDWNILCVNAGAWDTNGTGDLWPAIDNSGGHSFTKVSAGQEPNPISCRLIDIGEWLMKFGFNPDFVKIDTELAELRILQSLMRTPLRPEIAAEIHNAEMWSGCTALLLDKGYQITPKTFTNYYLYAWI